jgi:hypothetical protein
MAGAGNGDVSETRIQQVGVDACISIDEDALGGQPLGAVAGDGVAVVKMPVFGGVEVDLAARIESDREVSIRRNRVDHGEVTIGHIQRLVGRGELDAVAD